jgi:peptidoglycan-associated lipoprotein
MKKSLSTISILVLILAAVALTGTGCAKKPPLPPPVAKTEPPPPPPPPPSAPTVQLSASPSTIEKGQSTTLTWSSRNAANVMIDGGIGTVEASGNRSVSPGASTTYKVTASGAGGTATAETRITVTTPAPPPPPVRTISDSEFFASSVRDIYFDYDKYDIREDARAILQGDARALAERAGISFTIEGHCDERGSEKYNLALGDKRANSAKQYLVSQGVATDRVDTISYGEERQVCTEHTEACWQQNRRAHFVLR